MWLTQRCLLLLAVSCFRLNIATAATVTAANDHGSKLSEVRIIVRQVQRLQQHHRLHRITLCPNEEFTDATLELDVTGAIRRFKHSTGGEDSALHMQAYYDDRERLRLVWVRAGAINSSQAERRYYYSVNGTLLDRQHHLIRGEGYPWDWASWESTVLNRFARAPRPLLHTWQCRRQAPPSH